MLVIPALWRAEAGGLEFETSLGYILRPCLRKTKTKPH
jgi:hypothetical protein